MDANGRAMVRKGLKPNHRYTQIYADRIGFGYGSCKTESRKSLVTSVCFSVKPIGRSRSAVLRLAKVLEMKGTTSICVNLRPSAAGLSLCQKTLFASIRVYSRFNFVLTSIRG